jgi:hypothetical protein
MISHWLIWLVVWNIAGLWLSHHIGNVIIPTDELHHFWEGKTAELSTNKIVKRQIWDVPHLYIFIQDVDWFVIFVHLKSPLKKWMFWCSRDVLMIFPLKPAVSCEEEADAIALALLWHVTCRWHAGKVAGPAWSDAIFMGKKVSEYEDEECK